MGEFFRFLSDFIDSVFSGWRGKVGLIAFGMATSFLAIWATLQLLLSRNQQDPPLTDRCWLVIAIHIACGIRPDDQSQKRKIICPEAGR